MPINTAPKDGTKYLAFSNDHNVAVCHWDDMKWANRAPCVFPLNSATHWIPLPPFPAIDLESKWKIK